MHTCQLGENGWGMLQAHIYTIGKLQSQSILWPSFIQVALAAAQDMIRDLSAQGIHLASNVERASAEGKLGVVCHDDVGELPAEHVQVRPVLLCQSVTAEAVSACSILQVSATQTSHLTVLLCHRTKACIPQGAGNGPEDRYYGP